MMAEDEPLMVIRREVAKRDRARARLDAQDEVLADAIRAASAAGFTAYRIAQVTGYSQPTVAKIIRQGR